MASSKGSVARKQEWGEDCDFVKHGCIKDDTTWAWEHFGKPLLINSSFENDFNQLSSFYTASQLFLNQDCIILQYYITFCIKSVLVVVIM